MTKIARHARAAALIGFSLLILILTVAFSGCRATRPEPTAPPRDYSHNEGTPYAPFTPRVPGSLSPELVKTDKATDKPSLIKRIFSKPQQAGMTVHQSVPRKCKGCTFNTVAGDQNNAAKKAAAGPGATTVTKPDAPVATGAGDAVDLARSQAAANIKGDGNTSTPTSTAPEAPGTLAVIADNLTGPLGWVIGGAAGLAIIVFLIRRKAASKLV